jgi:hypothetical protein
LLATRLVSIINISFDITLELKVIFSAVTISQVAVCIDAVNLNEINIENLVTTEFEEGEF